jgi:chromosome segregation ATPase
MSKLSCEVAALEWKVDRLREANKLQEHCLGGAEEIEDAQKAEIQELKAKVDAGHEILNARDVEMDQLGATLTLRNAQLMNQRTQILDLEGEVAELKADLRELTASRKVVAEGAHLLLMENGRLKEQLQRTDSPPLYQHQRSTD